MLTRRVLVKAQGDTAGTGRIGSLCVLEPKPAIAPRT